MPGLLGFQTPRNLHAALSMDKPNSIGINKWSDGMTVTREWSAGDGDLRIVGWKRSDGCRAIETNGDPIFDDGSYEFDEIWDANLKK